MGCTRKVRLEEGGEGTYAWTERYGSEFTTQALRLLWKREETKAERGLIPITLQAFQCSRDSIKRCNYLFYNTRHLPFVFPLQLYLHQLLHWCSWRSDVWLPCGVSANVSKAHFQYVHTDKAQESFSSFQTQNSSADCNTEASILYVQLSFFYFLFFFLLKIILSCWGIQVSSIWLNLDPSILHQCF